MATVTFENGCTGLRITVDAVTATVELLGGDSQTVERSWPADPSALRAIVSGYGFQVAQGDDAFVTITPSVNLVRIHYKVPSSEPRTCVVALDELRAMLAFDS